MPSQMFDPPPDQPHRFWPGETACPHPTCDRDKPPAVFACTQHWFQLPATVRREIWAAYRAYSRHPTPAKLKRLRSKQRAGHNHWARMMRKA